MKTIKELEAITIDNDNHSAWWVRRKDVLKLIDECELKEGWTINPEELKSKIEG